VRKGIIGVLGLTQLVAPAAQAEPIKIPMRPDLGVGLGPRGAPACLRRAAALGEQAGGPGYDQSFGLLRRRTGRAALPVAGSPQPGGRALPVKTSHVCATRTGPMPRERAEME
jgi:hypothetical protein